MNLAHVLLRPYSTEKTTTLAERGEHTFLVHPDASKADVADAIAASFGLRPVSVHIVKNPAKTRVRGKHGPVRKRQPRKKAVLRFAAGVSFDALAGGASGGTESAKEAAKKPQKQSPKPKNEKVGGGGKAAGGSAAKKSLLPRRTP